MGLGLSATTRAQALLDFVAGGGSAQLLALDARATLASAGEPIETTLRDAAIARLDELTPIATSTLGGVVATRVGGRHVLVVRLSGRRATREDAARIEKSALLLASLLRVRLPRVLPAPPHRGSSGAPAEASAGPPPGAYWTRPRR